MKKPNQISNTAESLSENVHRHEKWLDKQHQTAKKRLSPEMFEMFEKYDNDLVMSGVSNSTRHTSLIKFLVIIDEPKHTVEFISELQNVRIVD